MSSLITSSVPNCFTLIESKKYFKRYRASYHIQKGHYEVLIDQQAFLKHIVNYHKVTLELFNVFTKISKTYSTIPDRFLFHCYQDTVLELYINHYRVHSIIPNQDLPKTTFIDLTYHNFSSQNVPMNDSIYDFSINSNKKNNKLTHNNYSTSNNITSIDTNESQFNIVEVYRDKYQQEKQIENRVLDLIPIASSQLRRRISMITNTLLELRDIIRNRNFENKDESVIAFRSYQSLLQKYTSDIIDRVISFEYCFDDQLLSERNYQYREDHQMIPRELFNDIVSNINHHKLINILCTISFLELSAIVREKIEYLIHMSWNHFDLLCSKFLGFEAIWNECNKMNKDNNNNNNNDVNNNDNI